MIKIDTSPIRCFSYLDEEFHPAVSEAACSNLRQTSFTISA